MNKRAWIAGMLACLLLFGACCASAEALPGPVARAAEYLAARMDETVGDLYVYRDYAASENHFLAKAKISMAGQEDLVYDMEENWTENPYSGDSCIRCRFDVGDNNWGGWMFTNGKLAEGAAMPEPTWGEDAGCTLDLRGATAFTLMARGETGGELVEFFLGGLGHDGVTGEPTAAYADSTNTLWSYTITLTPAWEQYSIDLTGADLSSIGCGFSYAVTGEGNRKFADSGVVFYLDDIRYEGDVISADTPRFIASYETDNPYLRSAAFSYDNALCAMAFLAAGERERAKLILDAFIGAMENDRYAPDRVRNAYLYGSPASFPGWGGDTRLPSFSVDGVLYEDQYQVGSNPGNTSFVALAMLQYYARYGGEQYLQTAITLADFVLDNWADRSGDGFFAGYDGWPETGEVYAYTFKSLEHNLDFYAVCKALWQITGEERYQAAAQSVLRLADGLYDKEYKIFWSGTEADGVTQNTSNVVLDVQVWSALALGDAASSYADSVRYAAENLQTPDGGYAFSKIYTDGGSWPEGTSFAALAFRQAGMDAEADAALRAVEAAQLPSGGLPAAAGAEVVNTGFYLFTGDPWLYGDDPHIAPVAWYILATLNENPYTIGEE